MNGIALATVTAGISVGSVVATTLHHAATGRVPGPDHAPRAGAARRATRSASSARHLPPIGLVVLATVTGGVVIGTITALVVLAWRRTGPGRVARRARRLAERHLPDLIELVVILVHAGHTPEQAIRALAVRPPSAVRSAVAVVVHRLDRGAPFHDAMRALVDEVGPTAVTFVETLATCHRAGAPIGEAMAELAATARQARRRLDEADARRLPVRLAFPLVCCTLPAFVLLAIAPAVMAALSSLSDTHW